MSPAAIAPGSSADESAGQVPGCRARAGDWSGAVPGPRGIPFEFALRPDAPSARPATNPRADIDRLVNELQHHARDPDAVRQAAGMLRQTIETSLWQSARQTHSRLPLIHAELFGRAAALFIVERLRWLASIMREWLVMLSSPRRAWWAVQAAWNGDDVAGRVREKAAWHRVDEVAVFERQSRAPLVRMGHEVPRDEDDWIASMPIFSVLPRRPAGREGDDDRAAEHEEDKTPVHSLVVFGERCEITARVTGHAPAGFKMELQALCAAADSVLGDQDAGRAEKVFRIKQIVSPVLKEARPRVAERIWNPLVILAVFLLAGAALLGCAGVQHLRWLGVVRQVDAEPGIEVLSHSSLWGHRELEILRDPLAADVGVVLQRLGVDPASIAVTERSFISADAPLSAAREHRESDLTRQLTHETMDARSRQSSASTRLDDKTTVAAPVTALRRQILDDVRLDVLRSTLELPGELEMSLDDGHLTARGALSEPAYTRLARASERLVWLKWLDLSQVRDVTAENLVGLREGLEKMQIEFVPASSVLPEASKARLQSVASEMSLLAGDAGLKAQSVKVQFLAGHPDMEESTVAMRVEIIRRELVSRGVPAACFDASLGVLDAPAPNTVAFRIHLQSPAASGP